jgi:hypothetical protein
MSAAQIPHGAWRGQGEKTVQRALAQGRDAHLDAPLQLKPKRGKR